MVKARVSSMRSSRRLGPAGLVKFGTPLPITLRPCVPRSLDSPGNYRDVVLAKKQPRKVFVQPNTFVVDGKVELKEYPLTNEGVIQSFIERQL